MAHTKNNPGAYEWNKTEKELKNVISHMESLKIALSVTREWLVKSGF